MTEALRNERVRRAVRRIVDEEANAPALDQIPGAMLLSTLLAQPDAPVSYRLDRLWPAGGRVLLYAQRKAGKTTLRNELVRALADDEPFLGQFGVQTFEGTIGVIDTEMAPAQTRKWMRDTGIRHPEAVAVWNMRGNLGALNIFDDAARSRWAHVLQEAGVRVLILDCVRPVLDAFGLDENRDLGRFCVAFDALLAEAGITEGCAIHHAGHDGTRPRGDTRLIDWADAVWRLSAEKVDDPFAVRMFSAFGRDVAEPERRVEFDAASRRPTLGATRRERALTLACDLVLETVRESADDLSGRQLESSAAKLADERGVEVTRTALREAIAHLEVTGMLHKEHGSRRAFSYRIAAEDGS
ncbi:AAA family ATPase [Gordonia sp. DT219]|uniref:AAA family ATPase n=1 Tax=Gordonia sp. DT219 TaxID=3416658 RepID=UPI003CF20A7E